MSRPNYVCTICSEHFTRKYSAYRHDTNIHGGRSEIVPFIEYMAGRSSGRYPASHPSWFRRQRQVHANRSNPSGNHAIADTASSFGPETLLQPYPSALPNSHTATIQQKLNELRILAAKYSFPQDARKILEWANIRLRQGDEGFLNDKLEQFRMLDRQGWLPI
ncbi:MAG: hypothetical protein WA364_03715 [Candidatus Nitrosopolaris sp.]